MTAVPHALGRLLFSLKLPWREGLVAPRPISYISFRTFSDGDTPARAAFRALEYPNAPPDSSLFEEEDEEYASVDFPALPAVSAETTFGYPCDPLSRLIYQRRYTEAETVKGELTSMGVPIIHRTGYINAALHVLKHNRRDPNRYAAFFDWLALARPAKSSHSPFYIFIAQQLFFRNSPPLEVATKFGLLAAEKGNAPVVGKTVVGYVARYAELGIIKQFLDQFYEVYCHCPVDIPSHHPISRVSKRAQWWNHAIRTQCFAARPAYGFDLLKAARERQIRVNQYTIDYLYRSLLDEGENGLAAEMESSEPRLQLDDGTVILDQSSPTAFPSFHQDRPLKHNLIIASRILASKNVSVTLLIPFFDIYKPPPDYVEWRIRVQSAIEVNLLRSRAYRYSLNALSGVLHAEMLHHHRRKQYVNLIDIFHKFFHSVTVPEDLVAQYSLSRNDFPKNMRIYTGKDGQLPDWVTKRTFNISHKLWADKYITSLVWNAMVRLAESENEVQVLYGRLKEIVEEQLSASAMTEPPSITEVPASDTSSSPDTTSSSTKLTVASSPTSIPSGLSAPEGHSPDFSPTLAPVEYIDNAHFLPFLRAFSGFGNRDAAARILNYMSEHGIEPNISALGTVAGKFSLGGAGYIRATMKLLDSIEEIEAKNLGLPVDEFLAISQAQMRDFEDVKREEVKREWRERFGAEPWSTFEGRMRSRQSLVAFTNAFSGFMKRRNITKAQIIRDRMEFPWGFPFQDATPQAARPISESEEAADGEDGSQSDEGYARSASEVRTAARSELEDQEQVARVRRLAVRLEDLKLEREEWQRRSQRLYGG